MQHHFHEQWTRIREQEDTYVLATVVAVRGSSSAKPGSRAIISKDGKNLWGWIGGGCAESFLIKASLEALKTRQSCVVTVDLDDELLGVGMPCGGYMDVFLEPIFPATNLVIAGDSPITGPLAALASRAGYAVTVQYPNARPEHHPFATVVSKPEADLTPQPASHIVLAAPMNDPDNQVQRLLSSHLLGIGLTRETNASSMINKDIAPNVLPASRFDREGNPQTRAIHMLAQLISGERNKTLQSLSLAETTPGTRPIPTGTPELMIIGRGRLAEELAGLGSVLNWTVVVNGPQLEAENYPAGTRLKTGDLDLLLDDITPQTCVVIASQHKGDHKAALNAIRQKAPYIGLIASKKRAGLVLAFLEEQGCRSADFQSFFGPAGLDLGAVNPFEIALSIIIQIFDIFSGEGQKNGSE